jgi:septal ring factor EnvC (AmiA/AmiB activator)
MLTRTCRYLFLFCVASIIALQPAAAQAQKNNNNQNKQDEKRENERVKDAEKKLSDARKELGQHQTKLKAAIKKLDGAEDKLTAAKRSLREAEDQIEKELGQSIGLPQAVAEIIEKRKVFTELSKPILEQLHASPEWKALEAQVSKAKAEKEELRENVEIEEAEFAEKFKALNQILDRPVAVETKALSANAECEAARVELDKASAKLVELRKKLSPEKIESHPLVTAAKKSVKEKEAVVKSDEKEVASARSAAAKSQREVSQAQSNLSKARTADAKDSNKNNNKKGKK